MAEQKEGAGLSVMLEKKPDTADAVEVEPGFVDSIEPQGFDAPATTRLLRKLDWHILPFMSLIYLCVESAIDSLPSVC